jgi:hypothetical protein
MIGNTKGGMNTNLHADARPIRVFKTADQLNHNTGATALLAGTPKAAGRPCP